MHRLKTGKAAGKERGRPPGQDRRAAGYFRAVFYGRNGKKVMMATASRLPRKVNSTVVMAMGG